MTRVYDKETIPLKSRMKTEQVVEIAKELSNS